MARKKQEQGPDLGQFEQESSLAHRIGEKRHALETFASRLNPRDSRESSVGTLDYIAGGSPFCSSGSGIDVNQLIRLSKSCFYTNQSYRNAILNQVFLSNSKLLVRGQDEAVVKFFKSWLKKINIWELCNQFFTEWYRSGNIFMWRATGELKLGDIREMLKGPKEVLAKRKEIGIRYIILDPESVKSLGAASLVNQKYGKLLTDYEVERLKDPRTPEEKAFVETLDEESKKNLKQGINPMIILSPENLIAIFNNKQPYEPLAVPTYSPILKSINLKTCMRQADLLLMETVDLVVLFITAGTEEGDKDGGNQKLINSLTRMMSARGAGRAIITHHSAKAEFILPDLNKILSPSRYEALDREIAAGLMDIFALEDAFASSYTKTKIYLELLQQSRDAFLTQFLIPEMEKIADELGFSSIPSVTFEEVTLENETEKLKIFVRLYEMGELTAEGLEQAFKTKELPLDSANEIQQKRFKKLKDGGLFQPIAANMGEDGGRPTGTTAPKSKNNPKPAGASFDGLASLDKIKENVATMDSIFKAVEQSYKEKNNLLRISRKQKQICDSITTQIFANEPPDLWSEKIENYVSAPFATVITKQREEIMEIAELYDLDTLAASIFYHGKEHNN